MVKSIGNFTPLQRRLCLEIERRLSFLQRSGCSIIAKQNQLCVYLDKEIRYSNLLNLKESFSYDNPIPFLSAGYINDSGADDTEYFINNFFM